MNEEQLQELENIQNQLGESLREATLQAKGHQNADFFLALAEKLAYKAAYERCIFLLQTLTKDPEDHSIEAFKNLYGIR